MRTGADWRANVLVAALFFAPFGPRLHGQSRLDASVALHQRAQKDALASPRRYAGRGPWLRLGVDWGHGAARNGISIEGAAAQLTAAPSGAASDWTVALRARREHRFAGRFTPSIGAQLSLSADVRDHRYPPYGSEVYGEAVASLELSGAVSYPLGSGRLTETMAVPALSGLWRPRSGGRILPPARVGGPGLVSGLHNHLGFVRERKAGGTLELFHELEYRRSQEPYGLTLLSHRVGLAWGWALRARRK